MNEAAFIGRILEPMATVDNVKLAEPAQQPGLAGKRTGESWLAGLARRVPRPWWPYLLILTDALLILAAFAVAYSLRYQAQLFFSVDPAFQLPPSGTRPWRWPWC